LPIENSDQTFSTRVTFPRFAVVFIAISVTLVLIACLIGLRTAQSASSPSVEHFPKAVASPSNSEDSTRSPIAGPKHAAMTGVTAIRPHNFHLNQELLLLFYSPLTLAAVIAILFLGGAAVPKRRDWLTTRLLLVRCRAHSGISACLEPFFIAMDDETSLLAELMLQAEMFCSGLDSSADDMAKLPDGDEFRLKISQCRGFLSQLQERYDEDKLDIDDPLTTATFRQLIMCLMWVAFRAGGFVDYKLFRKLVQIESGFTYLMISRPHRKS
jgi:hypothetical protein